MNVHVLDTLFQLPAINVVTINTGRIRLRNLANALSDIYLPVKRERLQDLLAELGDADQATRDALGLASNALANEGLGDLLIALDRLKRDPTDDETDKAIVNIVTEVRSQLQDALASVGSRARALDEALVNLLQVMVSDVDHLIPPIEAELARIDAYIASEDRPLARLMEEETTVNKLIGEIESISLWDRLKPLVESLARLAEVDPRNPLIGSIKAGIDGVAHILNLASNALRYEHLVGLRERVQKQVDSLQGNAQALRAQRQAEALKLEQLGQLKSIDEPRGAYCKELGTLLDILNRFVMLNSPQAFDTVEIRAAQFLAHARLLTDYLNELNREWRGQ